MTPAKKTVPLLHVALDRAALLKQLTKCAPFVERKTTIPILSNLLLQAEMDHLTITATDLDVSIVATFTAKVKGEGKITVPARRLLDTLKKLATVPDMPGEVTIRELDNHWVVVSCGTFEVKLVGMAASNYPMLAKPTGKVGDGAVDIPADVLDTLIAKVRSCICDAESRYTMNGALLTVQAGVARMVGTDGHRLGMIEADAVWAGAGAANVKALLPTSVLDALRPFLTGKGKVATVRLELGVGVDERLVHFQLGDDRIVSRLLTGQFPNWEAVLPKSHKDTKVITLDSKALSTALGLVAQFADERSHAVRFSLVPGKGLELRASSTETGEAKQLVAGDYQGLPVSVGFDATYVLDWLRTVNGSGARLKLRDEQSAGLWEPVTMEGYRFQTVIMPMRI